MSRLLLICQIRKIRQSKQQAATHILTHHYNFSSPFEGEPCSSSCKTRCHCNKQSNNKIESSQKPPWPPAIDVPESREDDDEIRIPLLLLVPVNEVLDDMFPLGMRSAEVVAAAEEVERCLDVLSACALELSHLEGRST